MMPDKALMTVQSDDGPPTLETAARQLGVRREAVDESYGVVVIDPTRGLYGVQVDAAELSADADAHEPSRGPFSSPAIAPFGPVRPETPSSKKTR